MDTTTSGSLDSDRISLRELVTILWNQRWLIVAASVLVTAGAGILSIVLPRKYTATVVVSPVSENSGGLGSSGMSSLLSQMGGLASFAGITAPGGDEKAQYVAILQSEVLTEKFIRANGLIPVLARNSPSVNTVWKANEFFRKKVRQVTTDTKSGLVAMSITWTDPVTAAAWANGVVKMTNDYIRNKAITESQRNIDYLNEQASRTDVVGVKQAVYSLMEQEIKKQMLAKGSDEYALKVIDQAIAPERAASPRPLLWTFGSFLGCIATAVCFGLFWLAWRQS